jgi:hypothetical protein
MAPEVAATAHVSTLSSLKIVRLWGTSAATQSAWVPALSATAGRRHHLSQWSGASVPRRDQHRLRSSPSIVLRLCKERRPVRQGFADNEAGSPFLYEPGHSLADRLPANFRVCCRKTIRSPSPSMRTRASVERKLPHAPPDRCRARPRSRPPCRRSRTLDA